MGNANEHGDWATAHHVFTRTTALHRMLERIESSAADSDAAAVRGVLHGAMGLYLTRYLNVPPARIPPGSDARLARVAGVLPCRAECADLIRLFDVKRLAALVEFKC
jgi:hypothetical protein